MKPLIWLAALCALLLFPAYPVAAAELGAPAAPLNISEWVKGDPVDLEGLKGKVTVVEFWATWCPPCRTSIPHLTALQEKYKDKAVILGITNEDSRTVTSFVERMGDTMQYHVAIDKDDTTAEAYMVKYGRSGIPWAFIVDQKGKMVWHDSPLSPQFDRALEQVVAGNFDAVAFQEKQAQREEQVRKANDFFRQLAAGEESPELARMGDEILEAFSDDAEILTQIALVLSTDDFKDAGKGLATKAADRAVALTEGKNGFALQAKARVLHSEGKLTEALEVQQRAIDATSSPEEKEHFQEGYDEMAAENAGGAG